MRPSSNGNKLKQTVLSRSLEKKKQLTQPPNKQIKDKASQKPVPIPQKHISKIQKPSKVLAYINGKTDTNNNVANIKMNNLPFYLFLQITSFSISSIVDVLKLSHVCKNWKNHIYSEDGSFLWRLLKDKDKIPTLKEMKTAWKDRWTLLISKNFENHQKLFCRLFDYGSTKQNIPNKLIKKLDLQINLKLNKMQLNNIPFTIKTFNFSSYLMAKVLKIDKLEFDFNTPHNMFKDKIQFQFTFYSRTFMFKHSIKKVYLPEEIYKNGIRQKAFNYYLDKNFIFTFFEGETKFLYLFIEFSLLEIINEFRNKMKQNKDKLPAPLKSIKIWKQLSQTNFENFVQYFKYQADFQLHFSFHNSIKQIFTHCDTKVFPVQFDNKSAYFLINIKDSFEKQPTYKLDNKMGMSQNVENLFLLDLILKDRDRFLITFSGFIYVKVLSSSQKSKIQDYLSLMDKQVLSLEYRQKNYSFQIIIVDQGDRFYVPSMNLQLTSSIIDGCS